jgi:hypothetical protein
MDYPLFPEAVARFRSFLDDQGHHGPIGWVFPQDVLLVRASWTIPGGIALRPRNQDIVVKEVAAAYDQAFVRRLGVAFDVLCKASEDLWCWIYCPEDPVEAEQCMMPDGLKLSVPVPPDAGRIVLNEAEWERLRVRDDPEIKRWRIR